MNKIPMQIYFDPETAEFYKDYAKRVGKSFAQVIREIASEKKQEFVAESKTVKKKKQIHPLLKAIKEIKAIRKNTKYYYPEKSDDELLYGGE